MLKRINRLPSGVRLNSTKTIRSESFLLKTAPNALDVSRFGFIISKKTASKAVDRNRSKRLLRSCVEDILGEIPSGVDYLFIIRKNLSEMKRIDLESEVKNALTYNS